VFGVGERVERRGIVHRGEEERVGRRAQLDPLEVKQLDRAGFLERPDDAAVGG